MPKRLLFFILSILLLFTGCGISPNADDEFTLRLALPRTPTCWNPHTRTAEEDLFPSSLCEMGFVRPGCSDSETGWIYEMSLSIEDITASFTERSSLGISDNSGRVFRIILNPDAVWEDGTPIIADTYLQSMRFLLDPQRRSIGAHPFLDGPAALFSARDYRLSGTPEYVPAVPYYEFGTPAEYPQDLSGEKYYLHLTTHSMTLSRSYSVEDLLHMGFVDEAVYHELEQQADEYGYIPVTEDNSALVHSLVCDTLAYFGLQYSDDAMAEMLFRRTGKTCPEIPFSEIGLRKAGIFELIYITESVVSMDVFLEAMTDNWLVYPALYEQNPRLYGTSPQTYLSYGPYRLETIAENGTVTLVRNDAWYGYNTAHTGPSNSPTRIQFITADADNSLKLWEHGQLDLCFPYDSVYASQTYGTYLQYCEACGCSYLLSPRLDSVSHHCLRYSPFICCSLRYNDTEWEIFRSQRGGYVVSPAIQKTP